MPLMLNCVSRLPCVLGLAWLCADVAVADRVLTAKEFGVVADGKTDDGPAIRKMVAAARAAQGDDVVLQFPQDRVVRVSSADESRYVFPLGKTEGVTVDGGGSTFVLAPHLRMVDLKFATRPVIRNMRVDFSQHPFIEAVVEAVDPLWNWVDVRCASPDEAAALGGPTKEDGEQAFIGFVWCENGPHPKAATHFTVKSVEAREGGLVRVIHDQRANRAQVLRSHVSNRPAEAGRGAGAACGTSLADVEIGELGNALRG